MSTLLTTNDVAAFESDAKDAYQSGGVLRHAIRTVTGVTGSTYRFHKIGKGMASPRIPQTEVIPMGLGHTNETATLEDWYAAEYTDLFDEQKVSYSERKFLASTIGRALARREDQLILDALEAATIPAGQQIGKTFTGSNQLNLGKIRRAKRLMDDLSVPASERYLLTSAGGIEQMLGDNTNTSRDFVNLERLRDGEMGSIPWLGFNWLVMDDRSSMEGGYEISTNDVTTYAWHKPSVGLAVGKEISTSVDWVPQYTSHLTVGCYIGGATVIDTEGVIQITYDQSIAV
jgi:hypothetical protein